MSGNRTHNLLKQLIKYGLVGVVNTLITFIVIYVLQEMLDVSPGISNIAGYIAGLLNSFLMNSKWTFDSEASWRKFFIFMAVWIPCYLANLLTLHLLLTYTTIPAIWSQLVAMLVFNISNFILNKFVTFKK
ncbi:GtrA family protein [Porphyromonadaceae bacterium W3.11]|nr:GtrA family protein [Porphyromonadaceae bacterium W3.11]